MSNIYIIQLIIIPASILLGMFIYPWFKRKYNRFIEREYRQMNGEKPIEKKKEIPENNKKVSIAGESKFKIGHSRTKVATDLENENRKENAPIFASESEDSDPEMIAIDVPLELENSQPENNSQPDNHFDLEEEVMELNTEKDAVLASGISYEELMQTGKLIHKEELTDSEKEKGGRLLYENKSTEMVEQITLNDEKTWIKVNSLISFHVKKYHLEVEDIPVYPNELKSFDINSLF